MKKFLFVAVLFLCLSSFCEESSATADNVNRCKQSLAVIASDVVFLRDYVTDMNSYQYRIVQELNGVGDCFKSCMFFCAAIFGLQVVAMFRGFRL